MWVSQSPWWCSLRVLLALSTTVCRFFGHPNPVDFDGRPIWHEKASGEIWRQQNFLPSPPFRFVFPWKWSASRRRHLDGIISGFLPWIFFVASWGLPGSFLFLFLFMILLIKAQKPSSKPPGSYKKFQGRNPEIISLLFWDKLIFHKDIVKLSDL